MQWFFTIATSGIGEFFACFLISALPVAILGILYAIYERRLYYKTIDKYGWPPVQIQVDIDELRHETLRKLGWPPPHCDVDGDPVARKESIVRLNEVEEEDEEE